MIHINFDKVQFVYIDVAYMKYLNRIDSEIFFNKEDENYRLKPHLGILLNNDGIKYVIPLTSAKEKHKGWADVTANWYRIYEVINIEKDPVDHDDIIVKVKNQEILKKIKRDDQLNTRQRILSVLDIRKMFPVDETVYIEVKFNISSNNSRSDNQRTFLMIKEYNFLNEISDDIAKKATKIYEKQIRKNKVLPYHCNYRKLEHALEEYRIMKTQIELSKLLEEAEDDDRNHRVSPIDETFHNLHSILQEKYRNNSDSRI